MKIEKNIMWNRWIFGIGWSRTWKFFQITFGPLLITLSWSDDEWTRAVILDEYADANFDWEAFNLLRKGFTEEQTQLERERASALTIDAHDSRSSGLQKERNKNDVD